MPREVLVHLSFPWPVAPAGPWQRSSGERTLDDAGEPGVRNTKLYHSTLGKLRSLRTSSQFQALAPSALKSKTRGFPFVHRALSQRPSPRVPPPFPPDEARRVPSRTTASLLFPEGPSPRGSPVFLGNLDFPEDRFTGFVPHGSLPSLLFEPFSGGLPCCLMDTLPEALPKGASEEWYVVPREAYLEDNRKRGQPPIWSRTCERSS